jgi:hypothetical protein
LVDQIHRAMRRFIGELQHVIETQPSVRHFLLSQIDQA